MNFDMGNEDETRNKPETVCRGFYCISPEIAGDFISEAYSLPISFLCGSTCVYGNLKLQ